MFVYPELVDIAYTVFSNCANTSGCGGALYVNGSTIQISHCSCSECTAGMGGFLYCGCSELTLSFSNFVNTWCTIENGNINMGGNIICEESGYNSHISNIQVLRCAQPNVLYGESLISSKNDINYFSFLNISNSFGNGGGFVSIRECKENSVIHYMNLVESKDFTLIENACLTCSVLNSNFVKNKPYTSLLRVSVNCTNCVFLDNADVKIEGKAIFVNCIGKYYGNLNNVTDTSTIRIPVHANILTPSRCGNKKCTLILSLTLCVINISVLG